LIIQRKTEESGTAVGNLRGKGRGVKKKEEKKSALGYAEKKQRRVGLQWGS